MTQITKVPMLAGKNIAQLRRMVIRRQKLQRAYHFYNRNTFAITVIAIFLIVFGAIGLQTYTDHQTLEAAKVNARNIDFLFENIMSQRNHLAVEIVEWSRDSAYGMVGSPVQPIVFDMFYLKYFGTAKKGDILNFLWSTNRNSTTELCPSVFQQGNMFLNACGLEPLQQSGGSQ